MSLNHQPTYAPVLPSALFRRLVVGCRLLADFSFVGRKDQSRRNEEHLLASQFGGEYAAYRREVPALVPFLNP
jgi:hypothetical protein